MTIVLLILACAGVVVPIGLYVMSRGRDKRRAEVEGDDNTLVNDDRSVIGSGNTIVGADADGNTIINGSGIAIGKDASASPGSIAIGARARA